MDAQQFNLLLNNANKNEKAFELLYNFYYRRIVAKIAKSFGKEFAEDVAQEFFIRLVKFDKKYEFINNPTAWVYTCCENIAKTKLAKEKGKISFNEEIGANSALDFDFENVFIGTELNKLDDISKDIVILHYWKGYNFEEISGILGITYDAIRQRHKRLKKKLKFIL